MSDIKRLEKMLYEMNSKIEQEENPHHKICGINGILAIAENENRAKEFIAYIKSSDNNFDEFLTYVFRDRTVIAED